MPSEGLTARRWPGWPPALSMLPPETMHLVVQLRDDDLRAGKADVLAECTHRITA